MTWTANGDPDFDTFVVERSTDNAAFTPIHRTKTTRLRDEDVEQDTIYYYRVSGIDVSGNIGAPSASLMVKTLKDLRPPLPPALFRAFAGNEMIQTFWTPPSFGDIARYEVSYQRFNNANQPATNTEVIDVDPGRSFYNIRNLLNGSLYRVAIRSISVNGVYSAPIRVSVIPEAVINPNEVESIEVTYSDGTNDDKEIVADLSWTPDLEPYEVPLNGYQILVIDGNGRVSEPIVVRDATSRALKLLPLKNANGILDYQPVRELTNYFFRISTIDAQGNISIGNTKFAPSPTFRKPSPITTLTVRQNDNRSLLASWVNSTSSEFSFNILKLIDRDNVTSAEVIIENNTSIGDASSYVLSTDKVSTDHTYTFEITPFDRFGNQGNTTTVQFTTRAATEQPRPKPPAQQTIVLQDGVPVLSWERPFVLGDIVSYRIWRAEMKPFLQPTDFLAIATVPASKNLFTDYSVATGKSYSYFVTSIDIFDQESSNPVADGFISYKMLQATVSSSSTLGVVNVTSVTRTVFDAVIEWNVTAGSFDGYEIWRSEGNLTDFKLVGNVGPSASQYEDKNALLKNGITYYYIVRRFRNEGDLFVTESAAIPTASVFIAKVSNIGGIVSIDQDAMNNIKLLEDPIRLETRSQLASHKHHLGRGGEDRRIDLSSDASITSWKTRDWQTFQTEEPLGGASAYIVRIIGEVNEKYFTDSKGVVNRSAIEQLKLGIPPFLFEVVEEAGAIIFEVPLFGDVVQYLNPGLYDPMLDFKNNPNRGSVEEQVARLEAAWKRLLGLRNGSPIRDILDTERPFLKEPVIEVTLLDITEVDNILPSRRVGSFDASQVNVGRVKKGQLPALDHDGRIGEKLIPLQKSMTTVDRYNYAIGDSQTTFSSAVTFYDILKIEPVVATNPDAPQPAADFLEAVDDGVALLAARSDGIARSLDYGSTWETMFTPSFPPTKLFYANVLRQYIALTNKGVYASLGELRNWVQMPGTENVKVIRDIVEDASGNLYISSDLGVYKLDVNYPGLGWDQTPLFGPKSTESYAMLYDAPESRIIVSNELGLLESRNQGATWEFISEFNEFEPIWSLTQRNGCVFAMTEDSIWRKKDSESSYTMIARLDCDRARNLVIYEDRLFAVTDQSVYQSGDGDDIYNSLSVDMVPTLSELNVRGTYVPATSLDVVGDVLFVGTEERLFFRRGTTNRIQYDRLTGLAPTFYVKGVPIQLGYYYRSNGISASFDEQIQLGSDISTAVSYSEYRAEYNGWAAQRYNADITVKVGGNAAYTTLGTDIFKTFDTGPFEFSAFPTFDTLNSNLATAEEAELAAEESIEALTVFFNGTGEEGDTPDFDPAKPDEAALVVADCLASIQRFLSQLFESARVISTVNEDGIASSSLVELPSVMFSFGNVSVDTTKGIFTFSAETNGARASYDRYDALTVDILKTTALGVGDFNHETVEDYMEDVNSGLPAALARVKQSATLKMGLYNERKWPGEQDKLSTPYQARYYIPRDRSFYDRLNSTVDYALGFGSDDISASLSHASAVVYSETLRKVFVAGYGGMLMVDADTLEISEIDFPNIEQSFIKYLHVESDRIYALSSSQIYESADKGLTWTELSRLGLPNDLYSIARINGNLVVGGSDGVYFKYDRMQTWSRAIESVSPVEVMSDPDVLFVVADDQIYVTADGAIYTKSGARQARQINGLAKYGSMMFAATNTGVYKDDGSFYGGKATLSLVDVVGDRTTSAQLRVNSISSNPDSIFMGVSDASVIILKDENFLQVSELPIGTVHRVIAVGNEFWAFGYDSFIIFESSNISWSSLSAFQWSNFVESDWSNFSIDNRESLRTIRPIRLSVGTPL
ncbi:MAG: fibronectin type III domain-containing protein [Candidatus Competibacteraceae bacterium]|nr:fibronectin type III domain-containing protein [Candidatus Competibacteraceae bacterium]